MNQQELLDRNKKLERRWKITVVVCVLFLITRPVALYIVNHLIKDAKTNQYELLDPALELIPKENFIVNIQPLRDYLNGLQAQYPDSISVYYEQLNSGANISVNNSLRLFPASLTKLPLAIIVAKKVDSGEWNWNTEFTVQPEDIDPGSGDLFKTASGKTFTTEQLLEELLIKSDNTAQKVLLHKVGDPELRKLEMETGLDNLFDVSGHVSAKEYTRLLRNLYVSSYLERENSEKILEMMERSEFNEYLSTGLPSDIKFAHKYGENAFESAFADSGIVYDDGHPYMLTVMIKGKDSTIETRNWAIGLMKEIAEKSFQLGK